MPKNQRKLAVLAALRSHADFSELKRVSRGPEREMRAFLRWLDQSGVALYLLWRLREAGEFENMPSRLQVELLGRLGRNRRRTGSMLADFRMLSECFTARNIPHAFLKGFTLAPDFCPALELRHQSDFDLLISAGALDQAKTALFECGYLSAHKKRAGELLFSSPLRRVPSANDDIYALDYQKRAELHTTIWEDLEAVSLNVPSDVLARARTRRIHGLDVTCLSQEDAFIFHLLHAFRHFLSSWTRVSWLWEIHYFLESRERSGLWIAVRERAGNDPVVRKACGLVLRLTNQLFGSPIPVELSEWCLDGLPGCIGSWVERFGARWALSELSGSKVTLLIHKEFVRDSNLWRPLLWGRIIPLARRPSLVETVSSGVPARARFQIAQRLYQARRITYHMRTLFSLAFEALHWRFSLIRATRNARWLPAKEPGQIS